MATKRTRIEWSIDDELSPRARAVAIALVLLRVAGVESWDDLAEMLVRGGDEADALRETANLPLEDLELLDEHERTLRGLRRSTANRSASIQVTIIECASCQRWGYFAPSTVPKKCQWSMRCEGTVQKIAEADMTLRVVH